MASDPESGEDQSAIGPDEVDPASVAERLPARPLAPNEMEDLADAIGWSVLLEPFESPDGTEYVPRAFFHDDAGKRALCLWMDESLSEWFGEVVETGVEFERWMDVNQIYAKETTGEEAEVQRISVTEGGEEKVVRDWRDDHQDRSRPNDTDG